MRSLRAKVRPSPEVLFREVGGEAVLLDLATEQYFGLDAIGTRLWALLAEDPSLSAAHATLLGEFEVLPERLEEDLLALVSDLEEAGLVVVE